MNRTQCRDCVYFKYTGWVGHSDQACHYMLATGQRREKDGDKCLSRTTKKQKLHRGFDVPAPQR